MKVVVFNGSPKGNAGNTALLTKAFMGGAAKAGARTEEIYLIDKAVHHCTGCFSCWFKTPGRCVFRDDMDALLSLYCDADIVCFATPVYTWNMTAALKNFVDRLAPLKSPLLVQSDVNFDLADAKEKQTKFVVIANAGFPGENNFGTIRQVFASCQPVLEIYRNCGMALKKQDDRVQSYLEVVSAAGAALVQNGTVNQATSKALGAEMIPLEEYVQMIGM